MVVWFTFLLAHASAGWSVDRATPDWTFEADWRDHNQQRRSVRFEIPDAVVRADMDRPVQPSLEGSRKAVVEAVRAYAKTVDGVTVTARIKQGHVELGAQGPQMRARRALREAGEVADRAAEAWALRSGYLMLQGGVTVNHGSEVNRYALTLRGLAQQLKRKSTSPRAFVGLALSMVQSIPYEARLWKGGDPGFRPPLALLGRRRGDCDSKTVLFLSLVRAAYPDVPLAVVYVPGHALAAVGLEPERGDKVLRHEGAKWVVAEPVGPSPLPLGKAGRQSTLARREVVSVPRR